jgi:beta-glucanase (GH16 family)
MIRESVLGQGKLKLVFSDEFNQEGRSFYENDDQFWQAADFHYAATNDLEWYDPDAVTTQDGTLQIRMDALPSHNLDYRSGMLQSWNKICFKGGVMEVSASLAGPAGVPGLWPGIWTLGNLARPGYRATSDGVWPYSYDNCDVGITPNQSSSDGISFLPGQKLAKCVCSGEEHPTPGRGRGAPEIDALEGTAEYNMRVGVVTQSSQVVRLTKEYL